MYFPKLENVSRIPVAERRTFPGDHVQHHADCHKANAGNDLPREMFFLAVLRHFHTFRTLFHRCICHCRSPRFMYFTLLSQHACLPDLLSAYLQIILSHKSCRGEQRSLVLVAYMVCINSNLVAPKNGTSRAPSPTFATPQNRSARYLLYQSDLFGRLCQFLTPHLNGLEQSVDIALIIAINIISRRLLRQTRHCHNIARISYHKSCTG